MCQNVPPLELYDDELFGMLRSTWQNALVRICVRLHKYGDAQISDEWLAKKLLSAKFWPEFRALMLTWGWLEEDPSSGNLRRAGILAPQSLPLTKGEVGGGLLSSQSAEASRKREERLLAKIDAKFEDLRRELGLARQATPVDRTYHTYPDHPVRKSDGQTEPENRTPDTSYSSLVSNDSNESTSHSEESSSSSSLEGPPPLTVIQEPQRFDVQQKLLTLGFSSSQCETFFTLRSIADIADGLQFLAENGWPKCKNPLTTFDSYIRRKISISSQWLKKREARRTPAGAAAAEGQTAALMTVDNPKVADPKVAGTLRVPSAESPDPRTGGATFISQIRESAGIRAAGGTT